MKQHLTILVKGKVQGVFFRASAIRQARDLKVTGFVRNEPDGSVYIEVEGTSEQLTDFVSWCKHGPTGARVDECKIEEGMIKHFAEFLIQR
ncbi:MAG TPA: acylphosphatase [Ohtaekwangia sp.]|nr:acylphosphatase [Ohtaekwangia sp.]